MTTLAWVVVVKVLLMVGVPANAVVVGLVGWELGEKAVAQEMIEERGKIADAGSAAQ